MPAMKILTAEQMRRVDQRAETSFGVSSKILMDNAGRSVVDALQSLYPDLKGDSLLIVCGKGNNGGDGIAAARYLRSRGLTPRVVLLARRSTLEGPAAHHLKKTLEDGLVVEEVPDEETWAGVAGQLSRYTVILEAVLGTGLTGAARGLPARVIQDLNSAEVDVVSLDIPSGLSGDSGGVPGPAVCADHTIALACPKLPHLLEPAATLVGNLHVVDIGIPAEALEAEPVELNLIDESEVSAMMPVREADSHKGDYGRVLVLAGSLGKAGAAAMVGRAALRAGAGLVTAATSTSAQPILAAQVIEMMTEALPQTHDGALSRAAAPFLRDLMRAADVLAVGPGLTTSPETVSLVREIVGETSLPVVLDADGINAFAGAAGELKGDARVLILTPHPGEMARLLSGPGGKKVAAAEVQADRIGIARSFARGHDCYLVLKGHRTLIAEPSGQVWINPTGNPGMATGGSGDVLTGILAGLLAQGLSPLEACLLGVYAHGLAGDLAAADVGETSLMARDIIDYLAEAFLQLERGQG